MRNKQGFTLVEILAVIVVLGLLSTLILPNISSILKRSTDKTLLESARSLIRSAENFLADEEYNYNEGDCYNLQDGHLETKNLDTFKTGEFCVINGQPFLQHVTNGELCVSGSSENLVSYKCGEMNVVRFNANHMQELTKPHVDLPYIAYVIPKGEYLLDYINDYKVTVQTNTGEIYDIHNFWKDFNLSVVPYNWNYSINEDTQVNYDKEYRITEVYNIKDEIIE